MPVDGHAVGLPALAPASSSACTSRSGGKAQAGSGLEASDASQLHRLRSRLLTLCLCLPPHAPNRLTLQPHCTPFIKRTRQPSFILYGNMPATTRPAAAPVRHPAHAVRRAVRAALLVLAVLAVLAVARLGPGVNVVIVVVISGCGQSGGGGRLGCSEVKGSVGRLLSLCRGNCVQHSWIQGC